MQSCQARLLQQLCCRYPKFERKKQLGIHSYHTDICCRYPKFERKKQPVAVREPIKAIVATAINRLIAAKKKAATKQEQSSSLELPSESRFGEAKEAEEADKSKT